MIALPFRQLAAPRRGGGCRWRFAAGWAVPAALYALIPKCPACIAAYLSAALGIGVSAALALQLRNGLLVSAALLLVLAAARISRTSSEQTRQNTMEPKL